MVALAFLIILAVFRGVLVAVKAAVLNVLSIAASYGVVVAVFQWGWGGPALGVSGKVPIESYVPMMMFAIVFGLSMDYEIFLLSRVHEAWLRTGTPKASVAHALEITARVITCAALIMVSVFAAFIISDNIVVKMLGLGLAVSVLIGATVVRLLLVPAVMTLLGPAAWWTPRWLAGSCRMSEGGRGAASRAGIDARGRPAERDPAGRRHRAPGAGPPSPRPAACRSANAPVSPDHRTMAPSAERGSASYPVIRPMLATVGPLPAEHEEAAWAFEAKWDGARCIINTSGDGTVRLVTRAGNEATAPTRSWRRWVSSCGAGPRCSTVRWWCWTRAAGRTSGCFSAGWAW